MELEPGLGWNTLIQHYGEEEKIHGAVVPPIFQNSLFVFDTVDELGDSMSKRFGSPPHGYSRIGNPSLDLIEKKLAMLEGTESCKVLGTGQAALTMAVMSFVKQGSHVVCVDTGYGPLLSLLSDYLSKFGVTHTFVDGCEVAEVVAAIRPETTAIYLESPSSLVFRLQDMEAIAKVARDREITTICDNTYNTPLHMRPHDIGIDIVCHSATKYLGGHSDLTAGAICTSHERMDRMLRHEVNLLGSILHPFQAWLLTRSLRTLSLRLARHQQTGNIVASWLESRDEIERVHHISLPSFPQHNLYKKMMSGSGGLFSFEPKIQEPAKVKEFVNKLKLFQRGVSWGGFESLAVTMGVKPIGYPEKKWIVRLFCGLEDSKDLIADLEQALPILHE
jgi:cystathionine beta-lyase